MTDPAMKKENPSFWGYLFWKWLICLLLTLPALAVTLLAASLFGQTGGIPEGETGFLRYGLFLAAFLGYALFLLLCFRIWMRLKLGKMSLFSFVLRETCAYAGVLLPCVLICFFTGGRLLRAGGVFLALLPHLPLAFFGTGRAGAFLSLLQLPIYAGLAALAYYRNRLTQDGRIKRGEEAIEGQFEEKDGEPRTMGENDATSALADGGKDETDAAEEESGQ